MDDIVGVELPVYRVSRLGGPGGGSSGGVIRGPDDVSTVLFYLLYLVGPDPQSIVSGLRLEERVSYMGENFYVFRGSYRGLSVEAVIGDEGDFRIIIGDGTTGAYRACNLTMDRLRPALLPLLPSERVRVSYAGTFGEEEDRVRVGMVCTAAGSGFTCTSPANASVSTVLAGPYEVYYIWLDGYRLEPPLRIRCSDPKVTGGLRAVYVEGFIPRAPRAVKVEVTRDVARSIVELARQSGIDVGGPGDLVVRDLHLELAPDREMLIPVLVLARDNNLVYVGLTPEGPILLAAAGLVGGPGGASGDTGLRLDWDAVLHGGPGSGNGGGGLEARLALAGAGAAAAVLAGALVLRARRAESPGG